MTKYTWDIVTVDITELREILESIKGEWEVFSILPADQGHVHVVSRMKA